MATVLLVLYNHNNISIRIINKNKICWTISNLCRPISNQPVEYAQVNETTKLKNKKKQNDTDQETVDTSAEIHEMIQVVFEERHAKSDEDDDHLDKKRIIR